LGVEPILIEVVCTAHISSQLLKFFKDEVLAVHQDKVQHFMNVNIDKAKKLLGQAEIADILLRK